MVEAFKGWQVAGGYAVGSVNVRLSTVKTYARLATKAGILSTTDLALIRAVEGYSRKEARRVDERREVTRKGDKKAESVSLTKAQADALKEQPDTPQGRRDAVIMALLLDHGLRVGELAGLQVSAFNLKEKTFTFYRQKVNKTQTHKLTADSFAAVRAWLASDAPALGALLRGSRKGGALSIESGMTERSLTERVRVLGEAVGVTGLSAHDCRHYWATRAARQGTDPFALQEAGGWSSLAMPRRYVESAKIANEGVKL
jgi:integrase